MLLERQAQLTALAEYALDARAASSTPSSDAAHTVHREAHGLVADAIYEVKEGS